jgi:CHAT domain-containing protein/tetratricopeptide (TPR) repeat protein
MTPAPALLTLLLGLASLTAAGGVVVEEVPEGFAAHQAGLRPGDVLLAWERKAVPPANPEPARGELRSAFDLEHVEREQAPRGEVTLSATRGGTPLAVRFPPGEWRLKSRPALEPPDLNAYEEARSLEPVERFPRWRALALALQARGDHLRAGWLWLRLAREAAEKQQGDAAGEGFQGALRSAEALDAASRSLVHGALGLFREERSEWDLAEAAYQRALEARRSVSPASLDEAWALDRLGRVFGWRGDEAASTSHFSRALALREALAPGSLEVARSLNNMGNRAAFRGDLAAAEEHHRRGLAIREALAPESLDVAASLNTLGNIAADRGDLDGAEALFRRALVLNERLAPQGIDVALSLHNLGVVALERGDLAAADEFNLRALAIRETLAPQSHRVSMSFQNLGVIAANRGDLAVADDYLRRALAIRERLAPHSLHVATTLQTLGEVALMRRDLASAEDHLGRSLAVKEKLAPGTLNVAMALYALANVALERDDLAAAEGYLRRSLAINETLAPRSLTAAETLTGLGIVAWKRGDLARAGDDMRRALAIEEEVAPQSQFTAQTLTVLGHVEVAAGRTADAETHYRRALDIQRGAAPGSAGEARACRGLAALERSRGRPERALEFYRCTLDAVEAQARTLGGTDEVRSTFAAHHAGDYRAALGLLLELGRPHEAFHVLERYRARGFLALLAERDLSFSADVPPALDRERRMANAEFDRLWKELAGAKGEDVKGKREAVERARARQAVVRDEVRAASPRLAALQYPEPLDLEAARAALDPGTLLLSYSIGEDESWVFAVGPGPREFAARPLRAGLKKTRETSLRFRDLLQKGALQRRRLRTVSQELGDLLLGPVAERIARARRLLIVADGPLHVVPFAALGAPRSPSGFRYLVEAKPVHMAASATVFAELKKGRSPRRDTRLIAFGDPDYSTGASAPGPGSSPALRSARERGLDLRALPSSRDEVDGLTRLYPGTSQAYLGADATEERAKRVGAEASLLHFACHGLADEASPLDSALALSVPAAWKAGRDNGLLQAWEVFEQVRIDADLVTLSACGTALGKEVSGEGILGLTRAFQYAGARSVLASLWEVNDDSTADLMRRFYSHLKQGQSKDRALRSAQLELIRGGSFAHPGRWAAFTLAGDWK